jgi:hypothetical protein
LADAAPSDQRVSQLVENAQNRTAVQELVRWATAEGTSPARIGENLAIFAAASSNIRSSVAARVDELSERLIHGIQSNLGQRAYDAWARLIACAPNDNVRFRAASPTLAFALRQPRLPVSSLIVSSFPAVHAQLLRSQEGDDRTIPAFLALPMSFFVDWDRAKSARRELVDAYLKSTWPPADLLVTAVAADIIRETLNRLSQTASGRNYIDAIWNDVPRLDEATQQRMYTILRSGQ